MQEKTTSSRSDRLNATSLIKQCFFTFVALAAFAQLPTSALADNPLEEEEFLRQQLREIGFDRQYFYLVNAEEESVSFPNMRFGDRSVAFELQEGLLNLWNIWQPQVFLDPQNDEGFSLGFSFNDRADWTTDTTLSSSVVIPQSDGSIALFLGSRRLLFETTHFQEWQEGNAQYAMAEGDYEFRDRLSRDVSVHEFRVIVERHPTSNGWFLSEYRGVGSGIADDDLSSLHQWFTNNSSEIMHARNWALASARMRGNQLVHDELVQTARRDGDVLQIDVGDDPRMVYLVPFTWNTVEAAEQTCEQLDVLGFTEWEFAPQYGLASVLIGRDFSDWNSLDRLREYPGNPLWGPLLNRLTNGGNTLVTSSMGLGNHDRPIQYLITLLNRRFGERTLEARSLQSSHLPSYAGDRRHFFLCLNWNYRENSWFRNSFFIE